MKMHREDVMRKKTQHIATADLPFGYWVWGFRKDVYQSRKRPYRMAFLCTENNDKTGNKIYADTGEFFVEERSFMPDYMGVHKALTQTNNQDNVFGGEVRPYTSVEGYLDNFALEFFSAPPKRLLSWEYLDRTPQQVEQDEAQATVELQKECADLSSDVTTCVAHRALRRTMLRSYEAATPSGREFYLAVGAKMTGRDFLIYPANLGIRQLNSSGTPFGKAPAGRALTNYILWGPTHRFTLIFSKDSVGFDEFREVARAVGRSLNFTDKVWNEMSAESERLRKDDYARVAREREASHRMLEQMKADHARHEAERARLDQMRAEQRAADRARRDSWNRQQELDKRRRNAWSDAIRGVDRYEHPYDGSTIEVRTGYGQRAFYNSAEDRIITADSDIDIPYGYEELKRKE